MPVEFLDYRQMDPAGQALAINEYEAADRRRGFDFKTPPLMRIALIRLSEERYHMLWSHHHILSDGWVRFSAHGRIPQHLPKIW